ncbi:MAG: hypothetical protein ABII95_00225 [Patescibacteria group bacterium]|nr:hypothetical protein [Patescibacteria group bacterium]
MSDILKIVFIIVIFLLIAKFFAFLLWILVPWFLILMATSLWYRYTRNKIEQKKKWILLELIPPRDIVKTPYGMEQFFSGIHGVVGGKNWLDRNIKGSVFDYFSLEMISQSGSIHFYVRTLEEFRDLVEAHIYGQYPETEIRQTADYINSVPEKLPNENYDVFGTEFIFLKENAYPIRTYVEFEKDAAIEEKRVDPMASLLEIFGKLKNGEQIWVQTLVKPTFDNWKKEAEEIRNKLFKRDKEKKEGLIKKEMVAWKDATRTVARQVIIGDILEGSSENKDDPRWKSLLDPRTVQEKDVITAIEDKMTKLGSEVIIRYVYLAPRDIYRADEIRKAIMGYYKQFNTQHLNGFQNNSRLTPGAGVDYWFEFKTLRNMYRRKEVFTNYRTRFFAQHSDVIPWLKPVFFERLPILNWLFIRSKPMVLNIEELASVFHFPAVTVKAPLTPKVESSRREPPIGLPIK